MEVVFDKSEEELETILQYFENDFIDSMNTDYNKFQLLMVLSYMNDPSASSQKNGKTTLKNMINSILDENAAKDVFSADEIKLLKKSIGDFVDACLPAVFDDIDINSFIYSSSVSDKLYKETESNYASDKSDNGIDKFAEDKKDIWQEGFESGYDTGYSAGDERASYNSSPASGSSDDPAYIGGYRYGYYEAYLLGVGRAELSHALGRIMTFASNAEDLILVHYPKENIKNIEKLDSYYTNAPDTGNSVVGSVFSKGNLVLVFVIILLAGVVVAETILLLRRKKA